LAAFERAKDKLREESLTVVAASTDPREKAAETVAEHSLTFPVGFGLPLKETAGLLGEPGHLPVLQLDGQRIHKIKVTPC
jgi:hypothetical protein